jgi:hypothetical protein
MKGGREERQIKKHGRHGLFTSDMFVGLEKVWTENGAGG